MDLSLNGLNYLLVVARHRNISRAAAELNISQPALSRRIVGLEARYGFPIFNRLGHGVEPTAAGHQLLEQAARAMQNLHVFESNMRVLASGQGGSLAIGMAPLLASELLSRLTVDLLGPTESVQLKAMIRPGEELLTPLQNDEIELIVYPEPHLSRTDGLDTRRLGFVVPACVVRPGHPLLKRETISAEDLSEFPWASSVEPSLGPNISITRGLTCDNYHILREAVLTTNLVSMCSREFVRRELSDGTLIELHVPGMPARATAIYVATLEGRTISPLGGAAIAKVAHYLSGK